MKRYIAATIISLCLPFLWSPTLRAEEVGSVEPPAVQLQPSPLLISAYQMRDDTLHFVQLYNTSSSVQPLEDWSLVLHAASETEEIELTIAEFDGWIKPRSHIVVANEGAVSGADLEYTLDAEIQLGLTALTERKLLIIPADPQTVSVVELEANVYAPEWYQRRPSTSVNGGYLSSHTIKEGFAELEGQGIYYPPGDASGIVVRELLLNAANCAPFSEDLWCNDYIKLYNSSTDLVDLSAYRLRTDSGSQSSTTSNTFHLTGNIEPGAYVVISQRDTAEVLSLTNTGGYVWIEDVYGVQAYEPLYQYPDASSSANKGTSWAYDPATASWKWMQPAPEGPNYWPPEEIPVPVASVPGQSLADCGPGRERNPDTNRCRMVASATTTALSPCGPGQERNPATNRCRAIFSAASTLKPCAANEFRNPETNRCNKIASTSLPDCAEGQERNPATNRCRKIQSATLGTTTIPEVRDVRVAELQDRSGWYMTGLILGIAVSYGVYEWRHEIRKRLLILLRRN